MTDDRPKREDYPNLHSWAQAVRAYNDLMGIRSEDLVKQWNEGRKNA